MERHMALTEGIRWSWEEIYDGLALDQLVPPPPVAWTPDLLARCDAVFAAHVAPARGELVARAALDGVPPWIFLEYAVKRRGLLAHGSNRADIARFEPKAARDHYAGGEVARWRRCTPPPAPSPRSSTPSSTGSGCGRSPPSRP
ncbi:MAG TPA: hypothetical protein VFQ39_17945 [Longimicrobium sp.]|nr:hypothetical protein [Longimicrobium sp.]